MSDGPEPTSPSHRARALATATLVALTFGLSPQKAPGTVQAVPPAVGSPTAAPAAATAEAVDQLAEIMVQTREPRYVAPTRRDQIGRIWAPVLINGRGPFRLVLDTGASSSGVTAMVAIALGIPTAQSPHVMLVGAGADAFGYCVSGGAATAAAFACAGNRGPTRSALSPPGVLPNMLCHRSTATRHGRCPH